jgi:hypothetical protein
MPSLCSLEPPNLGSARQLLLEKGSKRVKEAAAAYGDRDAANGVTVIFGDPGEQRSALTTPDAVGSPVDGSMSFEATVVIRPGQDEIDFLSTIAHEGSHLAHAQAFVATMVYNKEKFGPDYDVSKNLHEFDLEMDAYRITHEILAGRNTKRSIGTCKDCILGSNRMNSVEVDLAIQRILANPTGNYRIDAKNRGPRIISRFD